MEPPLSSDDVMEPSWSRRRMVWWCGWEHGAMEPPSSSDDAMEPPSDGMVVRMGVGAWRDGAATLSQLAVRW